MSKHELEDQEAMRLASQGGDKRKREDLARQCAEAEHRYRKRINLQYWAKLLGIILAGVVFAAIGVTGQVAGWIANVGMAVCLCWAAVTVDRKVRKV